MKRILLLAILVALPFIMNGQAAKLLNGRVGDFDKEPIEKQLGKNNKSPFVIGEIEHPSRLPFDGIKQFVDKQKQLSRESLHGVTSTRRKAAKDQSDEVLDSIVGKDADGGYRSKYIFIYNPDKRVASESYYYWDWETKKWAKNSYIQLQYDALGNIISQIYYHYDFGTQPEVLVGGYKDDYAFDANGNVTESISSVWDDETAAWIAESKTLTSYDPSGKPKEYVSYGWEDGQGWAYDEKGVVTAYDSAGNISQYVGYEWDVVSSQWILDEKADVSYNSDNQVVLLVDQYFDFQANGWVYDGKTETTYYPNKKPKTEVNYNWDPATSNWEYSSKYEYAYDLKDNQTSEAFIYWDTDSNIWKGGSKNEYIYDANDRLTGKNEYYSNSEGVITWLLSSTSVYYYSPYKSSGIVGGEAQATRITISKEGSAYYLNVSDRVWESSESYYHLVSPVGEVFQKGLINKESNEIQLNGLTKGVYILVLYLQNRPVESLKFFKK